MIPSKSFTCIDLFSGCGGFSLGMLRAGFRMLAAVDFNPEAVDTLKLNLVERPEQQDRRFSRVECALQRDLTLFHPSDLAKAIGTREVDVIVGGPPCQGFSTARQRDGSNHGVRVLEDSRRYLFREFLRYVDYFRPQAFVMENVLGIRNAAGGEYFTRVQAEARALGYRIHTQIEDAYRLGVPQKRLRQLFFGVRQDLPGYFVAGLKPAPRAIAGTNMGAALGDLPELKASDGAYESAYDFSKRVRFLAGASDTERNYLGDVLEIDLADKLLNHSSRPHSERDLRDFERLTEGDNSRAAMRRGVKFEFPYDKSSFKDRYTRQGRNAPCSTIVAHLSKDGLMFIHPTQNRSITPREAARVQSFPDWFRFPASRTQAFRLIGNAVPPLVSEAVGIAVKSYLERVPKAFARLGSRLEPLPKDEKQAVHWILPILNLESQELRAVPEDEFKRAWYSIAFLDSRLHPNGASEHGDRIAHDARDYPALSRVEPRLVVPYYEQSGWPVALAPFANEARRRYESGCIKDNEFYCSEAQIAGVRHRYPKHFEGRETRT
jgi:DNA (cytosine-5)-methyltransferase 1